MKTVWRKWLCLALSVGMALGVTGCGNSEKSNAQANAEAKEHVFRMETVSLDTDVEINDVRSMCKAGDLFYTYGLSYGDSGIKEYLISVAADGSDLQISPVKIAYQEESENIGEDTEIMPTVAVPEVEEAESEPETDMTEGSEPETDMSEEPEAETDITEESDMAVDEITQGGYVYHEMYVNNMVSDGTNLYFVLLEYYNDFTDPQNEIYEETYHLLAMDTQGTELWRIELGKNDMNSTSYFYVSSVLGLEDGVLCTLQKDGTSCYAIYGPDGTKKEEFTLDGVENGSLYRNGKGDIFLRYWGQTAGDGTYKQLLQQLDLTTKTLGDPLEIPGMNSYSLDICGDVAGGTYDLYLRDTMAIYGYNLGESDKVELLNFIDSDIDTTYLNYYTIVSDTEIITGGINYEANDYRGAFELSRLLKVDPADVKDKKVLTLATYGNMDTIRPRVIEFNKSNENYRIQLTDYSQYNEDGNWEAGIQKLNTEIGTGQVPDIVFLNSSMPVASYVSKGCFADLYPYIDEDPDMDREDFLANILDAFSVNGKLYQLVPSFSIMTACAKEKYVGSEPGWTVEEMMSLMNSVPDGTKLFSDMIRTDFLYMILNYSGSQYVDWKSGTCHFNSDSFIQLLEFANHLPASYEELEEEYKNAEKDYWMMYETQYRDDRTLIAQMYLNQFRQYQQMKYATFGEDITIIGFPSAEGIGSSIDTEFSIAMSSKCAYPDGAWEFMRNYLTEDYQNQISYGWPIRAERIEVLKEEAMQKSYYLDEDGNKVEYDDVYWIGDQEVTIPPASQEEIDAVMEIVTSVNQVASYDEDLNNIIYEEAEAFFSGQKTAKEVADIIQSRASMYVSESY